jgi:peptidoglycan/xylan/chitin deacetylase (PgdA/CDA1 family)
MGIRGIGRARRIARAISRRWGSSACILLYHRVADAPSDPQWLSVSREHFAEHLQVLRTYADPIQLQHLVPGFKTSRLQRRAVVVTFDDGYADNLSNAKPLLEQFDVPATVFVTAGHVGSEREFWWDELDRLLLQPGTLPSVLRCRINGTLGEWDLGDAVTYSEADFERHRTWNVLDTDDPGPRQAIYRALCQLLRPMAERDRRCILDALRAWAAAGTDGRPSHRVLRSAEAAQLSRDGLLEVGAHTVSHPVLRALPAAAQREEISESKARLEALVDRPVCSFAYPYGTRSDYTPETVDLVRQAGFACACSNVAELVDRKTDPFEMPRMIVRDWSGDEFAKRLSGLFSG